MSDEVPEYRKSNFTVALISEDGGFRMETSGEFSIFDQIGIVEAARALLRLQILNAKKIARKPRSKTTTKNGKGRR